MLSTLFHSVDTFSVFSEYLVNSVISPLNFFSAFLENVARHIRPNCFPYFQVFQHLSAVTVLLVVVVVAVVVKSIAVTVTPVSGATSLVAVVVASLVEDDSVEPQQDEKEKDVAKG